MSGVSLAPSNGRKMDRIRMFVALVNGVECFPAPQDEPFRKRLNRLLISERCFRMSGRVADIGVNSACFATFPYPERTAP